MKKLILAITGLALIACTMISRAAATRQDIATSDSEDSTVDIVAYFNNHDTLDYHDAATEESYECTTYMNASSNPETYCNTVEIDVVNNIPKEDLIAATTGIMEFFSGIEVQNIIAQMPDMPDDYTGTIDSYYSAEFLPNGWPNRVVDQTINLVGRIGRGKQTIIFLDYYNLIKD